ncbi:WD domain-containing protein [Ophiocordyceps sinensis CO18]|uniref:WD domain-containing protein n=1 Tax=Ophiocordyceps sinensis (strain Co18 / CGMCC 3.14243) TaxID=911162 RepID=T5A8Z9_OPHSC|nr:WD domain-containing protein [Ophiocordyceps sinensis CO18]
MTTLYGDWKRSGLARRPGCRRIRDGHFYSRICKNVEHGNNSDTGNAHLTLLASPTDSGYGSVDDEEHLASPTPQRRLLPTLDGPGSWDEPERKTEATPHPPAIVPPRGRPRVSTPQTSPGQGDGGTSRLLDRFIPIRDHSASTTERYHTAKQPRALSPSERLARRQGAGTALQSMAAVSMAAASHRLRVSGGDTVSLSVTPPQQGEQLNRNATVETFGISTLGDTAVDDGRGHLLRRGTNARLFALVAGPNAQEDLESYQGRVAYALDIDRIRKILDFSPRLPAPRMQSKFGHCVAHLTRTTWGTNEWPEVTHCQFSQVSSNRALPRSPFRVLDAPSLRDDYYCSVLAYSTNCHTLAVGLGNVLYTWSEGLGARMVNGLQLENVWLTSIAFSSSLGNMNILAAGVTVQTEDLVVGDGTGTLYWYAVEWPLGWEVSRNTWPGSMSLVAKISLHSQQICGLAWSPDGHFLSSGGNDNLCYLLNVNRILGHNQGANMTSHHGRLGEIRGFVTESLQHDESAANETRTVESRVGVRAAQTTPSGIRTLGPGCETQLWVHRAAVKAIAFCPWRHGLVATGGGSNDRCIHFFHTSSGSSTTRREIAATFGYAQPEHPYRVAVFSWPECRQVAAIPWEGELRALYAIPYPWSAKKSARSGGGAVSEGCIVVASSDQTVKFHEVWSTKARTAVARSGFLDGSDILEDLDGIMKEGDVIR